MCASCLCTTDGCVERNAFAQARALSAPSCHIDLSFRRQRGETFFSFLFTLFKICQTVLKRRETGEGDRKCHKKSDFLCF